MKIGVISDIHSNYPAFKACVDYMEREACDEYIFLGDYISDCPHTKQVMELLYQMIEKHSCHLIRGNREDYILDQWKVRRQINDGPEWIKNSASGNLLFTYERLDEKDLEFLDSLPITMVYRVEGYPAITCAHGSPDNSRQLLQLDGEPVKEWLDKIETDYLLCAHTHFPGIRKYGSKTYINSGCSGIAIGDQGLAQCLILHDEVIDDIVTWVPEFLTLPYDYESVVQDMFESGLYEYGHWFINSNIQILRTGVDNAAKLVKLATDISGQVWPNIDEKYFAQAAEILGVPEYGA